MNTKLLRCLLATSFLALPTVTIAQSKSGRETSAEKPMQGAFGPELGKIPVIKAAEINSYGKKLAVRIIITGADLAAIARDIKRTTVKKTGYDIDIDQELSDDVMPSIVPGKSTRIDLDLSKLNSAGALSMIVIKLENKDDRLSFMTDAAFPVMNGLLKNKTLRVAKRDLEDWTDMTEAERLGVRQIRFFVLPTAGAPEEPFNIGLLVREASPSTYVMPIWVDPKIKNTG